LISQLPSACFLAKNKPNDRNRVEKTILLVDDDPAVLGVLKEFLRPHYHVRIATMGKTALELARLRPLPDLVLLDVRLPDMSGYSICSALKHDELTALIPIIFLSSNSDVEDITHGLEVGAVDYISKPVKPPILLARVKTHLRLREAGDLLRNHNAQLEILVSERTADLMSRTAELQLSQDLTIVALGSIAETRDHETGSHIYRTRAYVEVIAKRLAQLPRYKGSLSEMEWAMIWKSAPLHDIGKVGIPDHILLKPGKLTAEEFQIMKQHPTIGRDALQAAEARMGSASSFLSVAKQIAYAHHERWDGTGYPEGVCREAIPLSARIMALADTYDAMTTRRVYKAPIPHESAIGTIREGRGKAFDPSITDCFLEDTDEFQKIALEFSDNPA
jgi:putative two-component system response regulator